ncbi:MULTISPECIES: hypothetical protein [Bartonella]|uniref:hypothetical protein n=1 Tax=Bartonella TaxID=773 RepID=UPI00140C430F|nr:MULTISPECIES: hypothetical protein [Bartonella]
MKKEVTSQIDYSTPQTLLSVLNHLQEPIEQRYHFIAELAPKIEALKNLKDSDECN